MNKIILVGRLTVDPELRTTQSGVAMCTFQVAVDRRFSGPNGERQSDFIPCIAWRNTGEFVSKYFNKGKLIGIEGSLQSRRYEDQQGNKRNAYEVVCDNVEFVGSKSESGGGGGASYGGGSSFGGGSPSSIGGGFDAPPPAPSAPARQSAPAPYQSGALEDFQEITDDEDLPF